MEYGVFSSPGVSWILVWIALSFVALGFLLMAIADKSENYHKEKKALWGYRVGDKNPIPGDAFINVAIVLFCLAFLLIAIGFLRGCRSERPSFGVYEVVGARLVYHTDYAKDKKGTVLSDEDKYSLWKPTEPRYFELKLEGRVDDFHPSSLRILRTISVPYDRIAENYKYTPKPETLPPTIKGNRGSLSSQPINWGPEITTPRFIVQYPDGWWKFTDTGPEPEK